MAQVNPAVASDLQQLRERFEDWRRTRTGKSPIPEPLWAAAAELARSHGVCRTAQALRLEYKKLKRLTDGQAVGRRVRRRAAAAATFMELVAPSTAAAECLIELEQHPQRRQVLFHRWLGKPRPLGLRNPQALDVRAHVRRFHVRQAGHALALAPVSKAAGSLVVSPPRVPVADMCGEEPEDPLCRFLARKKHDGEIGGQARERARFLKGMTSSVMIAAPVPSVGCFPRTHAPPKLAERAGS